MLGNYILYVEPALYSLIIKLVFETISFKGIKLVPIANEHAELNRHGELGLKNRRIVPSNEILFKRQSDFESPFVCPMTDEMEIEDILNMDTLSILLK